MVINVISSSKGGGAECLVSELSNYYLKNSILFHTIYFSDSGLNTTKYTYFNMNCRNPIIIYRLRESIKNLKKKYSGECNIHVHLTWPFFYTIIATLFIDNINLYFTEHNTTNKRRSIPFFWIIERLFYGRYKKVICISSATRKNLLNWIGSKYSEKLITIPNGARFFNVHTRECLKNRLPKIISIGSLTKQKNFITPILAISKLRSKIQDYTILGAGALEIKLKKAIKAEGLEEKVKLLGWVDSVERYLHASDIQIISSLWEGFGLCAVEGMSTGIFIVCSNVDGLCDVVGSSNTTAIFVDKPECVESWVTAINTAIYKINNSKPETIALNSSKAAAIYSLDKMCKRYYDLYS
jgi:glycosyltransferase involved in cell wall biosynthesis